MIKEMNSELAKLIYDLDWNEIKAFNIYNIRKKLSPDWFEYYIKFYFEKKLNYKMVIPSKIYSSDWGIDIKWIRVNNEWVKEYCIVQCKRHSSTSFWVEKIRAFVWWIFHILHNYPTTKAYFITTSTFTLPAIKFWNDEWISLKDFSYISEIYDSYSLTEFEKDVKNEIPSKYKQIFNKWKKVKETRSQWKLFLSEEDNLLKTLKDIRYTIMKKNHIYESDMITSTEILEFLSKKRPHNLDSLKSSLYEAEFKKEDIKNTLVYADEYLKWLVLYK